ncbi:DsbA family protein [Lysinibacter sp. HNR]|uniref:mycothiol-dependent nitroreductase Rv2466c family protein n=1 Tax=Lysinibacter sp. HNR TaxID=3031408 RepID=UPI0024358833|nr:DsbA family protein [Lysinibacter sp. HNR]WGD36425.1 DsbA family protein [Lysinibacter sp. HNR]
MTTRVEFWFDPSCPWAWMASRWVDTVAAQRDLDVSWKIMSLAILNEDKEVSPEYRAFFPRAMRLTRLVAGVKEEYGSAYVKPLYDALGTRIHPQSRKDWNAIIVESVVEAGLQEEAARLADTEDYDFQLRESHFDGINRVGEDVGTPVISVNGTAFFGPVISPAPTGEEALKLWDGVVAVADYEGFFEIKRTRTADPIF